MRRSLLLATLALYAVLVLRQRPARNACVVLREMPHYADERIPRLIHVQWHSRNLTEGSIQQTVYDAYARHFPDVLMVLWTDEDARALIALDYPWFLAAYDAYDLPIQRIDAARVFILHRYGGLYADLDYLPLSNFWSLLDPARVTLVQSPVGFAETVQNSLMASAPGAVFWLYMFDALAARADVADFRRSSGTLLLGELAEEHADLVHVLPCEIMMRLSPMRWDDSDVLTSFFYKRVLDHTIAMRACGRFDLADPCMLAAHYGTATYNARRTALRKA